MNKVIVETSDGVIWNRERTLTDLINAASAGPVIVNLNTEGPCLKASGVEELLDLIVEKFNIPPTNFLIETSNQLTSSHYKEHRESFIELDFVRKKAQQIVNTSSLNKRFGLFIGRSNWIRLAIASYLNYKYSDITTMTYHYDFNLDHFQENFGLETLYKKYPAEVDQIVELIKKLPIKEKIEFTYPIEWLAGALDLDKYYEQIFCDVVCETYFSGQTFFMTEKTMRPILFRRPFIVQGPVNFLKNLKKLGFKTFDQWWDEGYDEDPVDFKYSALKHNIDYIAQQPVETIRIWNLEMQDVLEHNYQTLQNLTHKKILETNFDE